MRSGSETGRSIVIPLLAAIASYALWNSVLLFPLKIFVVFLHEASHGLAAVLTGGSIERIELSMNEGGVCYTRGGSRFLTTSAGYLGSLGFGALFLVLGARSRWDRAIVALLGMATLLVTLGYVRSGFGVAYGLAAGAVLVAVAWTLPASVSDALLRIVGSVSALYAIWDIASDVLIRDIPGSDANTLGAITGIPGVVWGVVWIAVSLIVLALAFRASLPESSGLRQHV